MKYYTLKANSEYWKAFVNFRKKWRGRYSMSALARDLGFSASYIWEVMHNKQKGEISTRFVASSIEYMKCTLREAFLIIPVNTDDRLFIPSRCREQLEHSNPIKKAEVEAREQGANPSNPTVWRKKASAAVRKHLQNVF